ncbi:hypothetical protein Tco_0841002 [Tanacetum coccineum]|uniref:Uncharacterized protein n=1 Tax=Tanacetum coccineum TaxID=301880 RepID=A0ABQ5AVI1_9ASTR
MMTKVVKIMECGLLATMTQVSAMVIKRFSKNANRECLDNGYVFLDHERRTVKGSCMGFADFLQVRYGNQRIDDTTREQRYYEWVDQNYEFDSNRTLSTTVSDKHPYKTNHPTPIPFDEWDTRCNITYTGSTSNQNIPNNAPTPFSLEHSELGEKANISESPKVTPLFDVEEEYTKEIGNPYSRRFDEYKQVFDNEVEHLSNEYTLIIGKKGHVFDDVWEKCEHYHRKIIDPWHDEGFEEDELWRSRDEKLTMNLLL